MGVPSVAPRTRSSTKGASTVVLRDPRHEDTLLRPGMRTLLASLALLLIYSLVFYFARVRGPQP